MLTKRQLGIEMEEVMTTLVVDFLTNLLANIATALIVGVLGVALVKRGKSRSMKEFFGFDPGDSLHQRIFLSTIAVEEGGTRGTSNVHVGFHGDAITEMEYRHAYQLAALFTSRSTSWVISTIFGVKSASERVVSVIEQSPSYRKQVRRPSGDVDYNDQDLQRQIDRYECVILVGAPIYNLMTHYVMRARVGSDRVISFFEFFRGEGQYSSERGIKLTSKAGSEAKRFVRSDSEDGRVVDYFVVQKLTIRKTKVFVCAGTCTAATAAAVDRLRQYWSEYRRFQGDHDFGYLYKVSAPGIPAEIREADPESAGVEITLERSYPPKT